MDDERSADVEDSRSELLRKSALTISNRQRPYLRYHKASLFLLVAYIPLLVIPWIVECVLMYRPLTSNSYIQQRSGLALLEIESMAKWATVIAFFNKIQALVAIPITSSLLAQAAVVYTQRSHTKQKLSIRQLLIIADRSWADIIGLWNATASGAGSALVWSGGLLILIVSLQPPLQSLLVPADTEQVVTCQDIPNRPYLCSDTTPPIAGYDPEPAFMAYLPQSIVVQKVSSNIITVTENDVQAYMWPESGETYSGESNLAKQGSFSWYYGTDSSFLGSRAGSFFVSALPNSTTTGVLRQHAMRFNSTTDCRNVTRSEFPTVCPGNRPFLSGMNFSGIEVRICAPGEYGQSPWTISRDRQDISEDLWIDAILPTMAPDYPILIPQNFTTHCTTNTTRGYFELGNFRNNFQYGPLLREWPDQDELKYQFNDYIVGSNNGTVPSVMDNYTGTDLNPTADSWTLPLDGYSTTDLYAAGPLMLSMLAMFGNNSFWSTIKNPVGNETMDAVAMNICQSGNVPFVRLNFLYNDVPNESSCEYMLQFDNGALASDSVLNLKEMLYLWVSMFNKIKNPDELISIATYFANEAVLTSVATTSFGENSRIISTSNGQMISKPYKSLYGLIIISILIAIQLAATVYLVTYIYSTPTWTAKLDAFALVRIGAEMERQGVAVGLPYVGFAEYQYLQTLKKIDGLVGMAKEEKDDPRNATTEHSSATAIRLSNSSTVEATPWPIGNKRENAGLRSRLSLGGQPITRTVYEGLGTARQT